MCGRVIFPGSEAIVKELGLIYNDDVKPKQLNSPPGSQVPIIMNDNPSQLTYSIWSIIAKYSSTGKPDYKYKTFNAKIENLFTSGMWKPLIGKQHCIFVTSGFYEWQVMQPDDKKSAKQIYYIKEKNSPLTFMAGLWDIWVNKSTGVIIPNCSMITVPANEIMSKIHNVKERMPAFLNRESLNLWLDNTININDRMELINPVDNDFLDTFKMEVVGQEEEFNRIGQFYP